MIGEFIPQLTSIWPPWCPKPYADAEAPEADRPKQDLTCDASPTGGATLAPSAKHYGSKWAGIQQNLPVFMRAQMTADSLCATINTGPMSYPDAAARGMDDAIRGEYPRQSPMPPFVTTLALVATTLNAAAVFALVRALLRAEQGYEDETGFHLGCDPSAAQGTAQGW